MHTRPHIPLTQAEIHMHAQVVKNHRGLGGKEGYSKMCYQLDTGTQKILLLQAKQESKLKQRENTGKM